MCSYKVMTSKGTYPSKENMKLPFLLGWMLQWPAQRGIGFTSSLVILSLTSQAMASAAHERMYSSLSGSMCPPVRRTVTSIIVGRGLVFVPLAFGCWMWAVEVAAFAKEVGVVVGWVSWVIDRSTGIVPLCFFWLLPFHVTSVNSSSSSGWLGGEGCSAMVFP